MKPALFGAGAIGSHVAARLAQAGRAEVSVIARGPQLEVGRALEGEALLSVPLQLAREAGAAAPVFDLLVALARQPARAD